MFKLINNSKDASTVINAFRNGTAPIFHADSVVAGRAKEIQEFKRCLNALDQGQSLVKIITGDYGVGKTHLVNTFKMEALKEDYVIASFQVNNGFRLNKIDDLYYAIMHNLYTRSNPHEKTTFHAIFDLWIENLQTAPFPNRKRFEINTVCQELSKFNMNFARAFLMFMRGRIQRNQEMQMVTTAWLTGERNIPIELKQKYELAGFVDKTNTFDFLKAFAKLIHLLDYKGLIIFIDELDQVLNERKDLRLVAYNNLKHLIDLTTSGDMQHTFFVFSGTPDLINDHEKGFLSLESLAQRLNLDIENAQMPSGDLKQTIIKLSPLPVEVLMDLTEQIVGVYKQQTPTQMVFPPVDHLISTILKATSHQNLTTRHYVTHLINQLDLHASS